MVVLTFLLLALFVYFMHHFHEMARVRCCFHAPLVVFMLHLFVYFMHHFHQMARVSK